MRRRKKTKEEETDQVSLVPARGCVFFLFWGVRVQCELILVSNHVKLKITSVASKFNADATAVHNNEKRRKNP